jgi:ATP-dependent DNA helicase RecQ
VAPLWAFLQPGRALPSESRDPLQVLQQVWGYPAFRGPQEAIVSHVLSGGSGLVLMPTGGGKSLCYQVPALCRAGLAVVISPLIALMQDQVAALRQLGVAAAALHSALEAEAVKAIWRQLQAGSLDLLYVSPERLLSGDLLEQLALLGQLSLFAIDEAHCVSQWGHDFRPDYIGLGVLAERFPGTPRLALTATADPRTRSEIIERLHLQSGQVFLASFDRPNIRYLLRSKAQPQQQLLQFLADHQEEAGIIYARSRSRVDAITVQLRRAGFDAVAYHAGLSSEQRHAALARFRNETAVVVVATIAFGMGIDKPDVRFVAHVDLPKSLEAYYQETGRAGRDGLPAVAWMLHGPGDIPQLRRFIDDSAAPDEQKRIEHGKLEALIAYSEAAGCRRQVLLRHFGEELVDPCGNCDGCLEPRALVDLTVPAQKLLSAAVRTGQRFGAAHVVDVLLGATTDKIRQLGHDQLSVYGIGGELDRGQWRTLVRQLSGLGYLQPVPGGKGGLQLGPQKLVRPLLRGETVLELPLPPPQKENRRRSAAAMASRPAGAIAGLDGDLAVDEDLLKALKAWRLEQARSQGVPPYVVFHDRTLVELAARRPCDREALGTIGGIGTTKLERYGDELLAVLQAGQHGIQPDSTPSP